MADPRIGWFESGLVPYGLMPTLAEAGDSVPSDWKGTPESFPEWREQMLTLLNRILWPRCNQDSRQWEGKAIDVMSEITDADLKVLRKIRQPGPDRLIDRPPDSLLRQLSCPPHKQFFEAEDGDASKKVDTHRVYNRKASKEELLDAIPELLNRGLFRKCPLDLIFWFKKQLQRPRPYQTGLLRGVPFTHEGAKTGLHPSMISGHCLQGVGGLMGVAEHIELQDIPQAAQTWEAICQFSVDFGDRRVMAGVHYPSDNLASWILALELCDLTVTPRVRNKVKQRLWFAISERSLIFKEIERAGSDAYKPGLKELLKRAPK